MGNKAVVCFGMQEEAGETPVLVFHWNGGPECIWALVDTARETDHLSLSSVAALARMVWPDAKTMNVDTGHASEESMARSAPENGAFFFTYGIAYPRRKVNTSFGVTALSLQEVLLEARAARANPTYSTIRAFLREALAAQERIRYAWECGAIAAA